MNILQRWASTFRALDHRPFRLFFFGQWFSQTGTWMQSVAVVWLVLEATDSGVALGLATAAQFGPVLLLVPWAGVISDRVDRHRMLMWMQIMFAVIATAFAALALADQLSLLWLYVLSILNGVVTAFDNPVRRAYVVELVSVDAVANAVGLNSTMMVGTRVLGPAVAGLLIERGGPAWCLVANALSYPAIIVALAAIRRDELRPIVRQPRRPRQLRDGVAYAWRTTELRLSIVLLAVVGLFTYQFPVTFPLFAERTFDRGASGFTILYASMSAGAVVGALLIARAENVGVAALNGASFGLGLGMVLMSVAPSFALAAVISVVVGTTSAYLLTGATALVQIRAEATMVGRLLALTAVLVIGTAPVGGPIVGMIADQSPRLALAFGGLTAVAVVAYSHHAWVSRQRDSGASHTTQGDPQWRSS